MNWFCLYYSAKINYMETVQLKLLFVTLDDIRRQDENGVEFWYARELFPVLGYTKWDNFLPVIEKAKIASSNSGGTPENHFLSVQKMVTIGSGAARETEDIKLNRYACYLIAVNGDPRKQEIAFAQAYFVSQTRRFEVLEKKMEELARLDSRDKLKTTEKEFGAFAFSRGVDGSGIAKIRSRGDEELFGGKKTNDMKQMLGVPPEKPLADFLPNVTLKAKDLATAMTMENARNRNLQGLAPIGREHVSNNQNVREALVKTGIYPESLPAAEDIKQIEKRHAKELKELQKKQRSELTQASQQNLLGDK